ncbi:MULTISPECIES: acetolactate synthase 2 catalytic subunit [Salinivibrio]|uniref:Acetolactate synthase n=1 Tax=Salinivibrio costicola TaxID=51367 RepID=A0ABX6KA83_SALCS|nr:MULTISPECIES: acetolactate synthase 2 catalytic subunit [Salinivibrio]PCE68446.1 acetolactate synthase 2 catalytic subunit [Salinivibrio sp. YCSC6]QCF37117.1 acetolactate synthase 2 catalytic subunit [Salinivibrio sp. YCSC6]QIR07235.1 acetolactate synthase 2 catalytic subunit [Salinivibrio costicola]
MTGAQWVVEALRKQGVETVFGYPGGAIMPVYDALYDGGVEHILCRHEQGAAMAAIGYARASGRPGVCLATSGPGATNLITGLADAMMDSVPVVAITGQVASPLIGTDAFQEIDVLGLSLACTKHSFLVTDPADLTATLEKAFVVAQSGRPGPVLVDIAKDVQQALIPAPREASVPAPTGVPLDAVALEHANALIQNSERPMLYVGGGVVLGKATAALRDYLTRSQMPVVSTLKGLGTVNKDYPHYLGMLGMHGTKAANLAVQQCDLLIAVGARFDDRVTGKLDTFAPHAKVVHVDIDAAELNKLRRAQAPVCAELNTVLPKLATPHTSPAWREQVHHWQQQHAWRYDHPGDAIYAPALLKTLSDSMPEQTVIATDVGQHQMWVAQHVTPSEPENLLTSAGLGTMGFGLPAAMGAKIARPDDEVVLVTGDGSFMMNIQELGTLKRRGIGVKIILLDNQRLGMVRQWQQLFFDQRYSETNLSDNPDFLTLARAFDIPGHRIRCKEEIHAGLTMMMGHPGPYLLHVAIDEMENVWPLVPPGAANQQMMEQS